MKRKNWDELVFNDLKEHLQNKCEEHLTPDTLEYIDWNECKSSWWGTSLEARYLPRALEHLALGGVLFDEKYTRAVISIFDTLIRQREERLQRGIRIGEAGDPWINDNINGSNLNVGTASLSLAVAFDLIRHGADQETVDRIAQFLIPFVEYLADRPVDPENQKPEWNFAVHARAGLGTLALVLHSSGHLSEERFSQAIEMAKSRTRIALDLHHEADGAFLEGPQYGVSEFHSVGIFSWALARTGDRSLLDHPVWTEVVLGILYELLPGGQEINLLNDSKNEIFTIDWLAMVAAERGDGIAQWLWQSLTRKNGKIIPESPKHNRKCVMTCYLFCYDPKVASISPDRVELPTSKYFRRRNIVDIRTGWKEDHLFFSFICDITPRGGHRQADRNHFSFHCLGEAFAIDCGKQVQKSAKGEPLLWGGLGESHSIPLFQGEMQKLIPAKKDGIRHLDLKAPVPHIEAEAGDGYFSVSGFRRRVAMLPAHEDFAPCLVISDFANTIDTTVRLNTWLLHTHRKNQVEIRDKQVLLTGGRKGNQCLVEMVNTNFGCWRSEEYLKHTRLRFDWFAQPLYCIVVMIPVQKGGISPIIRSQATKEGCAVAVQRKDRVDSILCALPRCTLQFGERKTTSPFEIISEENGHVTYQHVSPEPDSENV